MNHTNVISAYVALYLILGDTPARFASQPRPGRRPWSLAAIYGTNSLRESTFFVPPRTQIDAYLLFAPSIFTKRGSY